MPQYRRPKPEPAEIGGRQLRVVLSTYGSRGDVEPLAGLAVRLRALGVQTRVCAPPEEEFAHLLARVGMPLVPAVPSVRELVRQVQVEGAPPHLPRRAAALVAAQFDAVAAAGHGAKVLLADGNYPVSTRTPPTATRVYLNLAPGIVTVTDVLAALVPTIPIEAAEVMIPDRGPEPPIFAEFRRILAGATTAPGTGPATLALSPLGRHAFYDAASAPDVAVAVGTGERRIYANLLLTIGVVAPDADA